MPACFARVNGRERPDGTWGGEALAPARFAASLLLLVGGRLVVGPAGVRVEPAATPALRGAGLARVRVEGLRLPEGPPDLGTWPDAWG